MRNKDGAWSFTCYRCLTKLEDIGSLEELKEHVALHRAWCGT